MLMRALLEWWGRIGAPLGNIFTFGVQDTLKQAVNDAVKSFLNNGLTHQANMIVDAHETMAICAVLDTVTGIFLAIITLLSTLYFLVMNRKAIKEANAWVCAKWKTKVVARWTSYKAKIIKCIQSKKTRS